MFHVISLISNKAPAGITGTGVDFVLPGLMLSGMSPSEKSSLSSMSRGDLEVLTGHPLAENAALK